jgi:hypothetical protein
MPRTVQIVSPVTALVVFTLAVSAGGPALAAERCSAAPNRVAPEASHWYYRTNPATGRKCWFLRAQNPNAEQAGARTAEQVAPRASAQSAAADCLAAPGSDTAEGRRWYFRIDRATQRKCWFLGPEGRKAENAARRALAQANRDESIAGPENSDTIAQKQSAAASVEESLTQKVQRELHPVQTWSATQASDALAAPAGTLAAADALLWPAPLNTIRPGKPPADAPERHENRTHAGQAAEGPTGSNRAPARQSVAAVHSAAYSAQIPLLLVVAGALLLTGILARAFYDVVAARRRHVYVQHDGANPSAIGVPSSVPSTVSKPMPLSLPPMEPIRRLDDVDDALRHFARAWDRRAA